MLDLGRSLRKAALIFVATACTGCGLYLVFRMLPDRIGIIPTSTLLALLGLLVLPGVTLAALELDRRAVRRTRAAGEAADACRREAHEPAGRPESGERHRRRVGSSAAVD